MIESVLRGAFFVHTFLSRQASNDKVNLAGARFLAARARLIHRFTDSHIFVTKCGIAFRATDMEERIERQQTFEIRRQQTLEMNEMNEIERQQTKKVKRQTLHAAET